MWNLGFLHGTFFFWIAVEEGVFYFPSSSISWLRPFARELPSMAELMDDFRVSEAENVSAQPGLEPPCAEEKELLQGQVTILPSQNRLCQPIFCLWSGKEQRGKTILQEREGLLMSLPLLWSPWFWHDLGRRRKEISWTSGKLLWGLGQAVAWQRCSWKVICESSVNLEHIQSRLILREFCWNEWIMWK